MATITTSIEADDSEMTLGFSAGGVEAHALNSKISGNKNLFFMNDFWPKVVATF
jgi:hypothetical protein